jgi:hypothetical protein
MIYQFRTKDHPEANGRAAQDSERQYRFFFPLEGGATVVILGGQRMRDALVEMLRQEDADEAAELAQREREEAGELPW